MAHSSTCFHLHASISSHIIGPQRFLSAKNEDPKKESKVPEAHWLIGGRNVRQCVCVSDRQRNILGFFLEWPSFFLRSERFLIPLQYFFYELWSLS